MTRRSLLALAAAPVLTPAGSIEDKIRGGFLGQVLGDLNGLVHEMKYLLEPGDVRQYTPALPTDPIALDSPTAPAVVATTASTH